MTTQKSCTAPVNFVIFFLFAYWRSKEFKINVTATGQRYTVFLLCRFKYLRRSNLSVNDAMQFHNDLTEWIGIGRRKNLTVIYSRSSRRYSKIWRIRIIPAFSMLSIHFSYRSKGWCRRTREFQQKKQVIFIPLEFGSMFLVEPFSLR